LGKRAWDFRLDFWDIIVTLYIMAVGMKDPVLGPLVMQALQNDIRNCPEAYEHSEAGHFVQEWGEEIAREAIAAFNE